MQDVLTFVESVLTMIPEFLLTSPIKYFVGIFFLFAIIGIVIRICRL